MKIKILNTLSLLVPAALFGIKKAFAEDKFLAGVKRPEYFEITDFKMPTFRINLDKESYERFYIGFQCEMDMTPGFVKRNEKCYRASWVDLKFALNRVISKNYIDVASLKKSKDYEFVQNVLEKKTEDITLEQFENIVVSYSNHTLEEIFSYPYGLVQNSPDYSDYSFDFETTDNNTVSMTYELDGDVKTFDNVKFSVGGRSTKSYSKLGYNVKIKKGKLYGIKQLRFRSEVVDPSFLRDKLAYDIHHLVGLNTLNANYCKFYINDHYMGIYLIRDSFKNAWFEMYYGEKDSTHIYKCYDTDKNKNPFLNCKNDDDTMTDDPEWDEFLKKLANAKNRKDLEEFFDVDSYIKSQVARYLFGSCDHTTNKQNSYVYKSIDKETGKEKWIYLLYDFDFNFGGKNSPYTKKTFDEEIIDKTNPFYELLDLNSSNPEIRELMVDMMKKVFNPMTLLPRIDQLRDFLQPYIKEDRTPDENGHRPGRFDRMIRRVEDSFNYEDFLGNTEFTTIKTIQHYNDHDSGSHHAYLGLKHWMIERFTYACNTYDLDCSFADEFLSSPFANFEVLESKIHEERYHGCHGDYHFCCTTSGVVYDDGTKYGLEGGRYCIVDKDIEPKNKCFSIALGYDCCTNPKTKVSTTDKDGEWGIENNQWCGINDIQKCPTFIKGYKCCSSCNVTYTDADGDWSIENNEWCSIPYSCNKK